MSLRFVPVLVLAVLFGCAKAPAPSDASTSARLEAHVGAAYRDWVVSQSDLLMSETGKLVDAIVAGDRARARQLYVTSRRPYERIEPVAESLGDLDPRIDAREGDVPADQWGGFHVLEKILWSNDALTKAVPVAKTLLADVQLLRAKVDTLEFSDAFLVAGSVELLNEVSTSKVTGEEERYSHTDLDDIVANVEGSHQIARLLNPALTAVDAALAKTIEERFAALEQRLAALVADASATKDLKPVSADVDAVAEALSKLGQYLGAQK